MAEPGDAKEAKGHTRSSSRDSRTPGRRSCSLLSHFSDDPCGEPGEGDRWGAEERTSIQEGCLAPDAARRGSQRR